MRRWIANSLLLWLCTSLLAPTALAWLAKPIPACCRRGGKHHCTSSMSGIPDDGPGFRTIGERCPYRSLKPSPGTTAQPQPPGSTFVKPPDACVPLETDAPRSGLRTPLRINAERGPPLFLL